MLSNGVETAFFRSLQSLQSHELLFYEPGRVPSAAIQEHL